MQDPKLKENSTFVREKLGTRTVALVGLMGAGKSAIGRNVAAKLQLPFVDADTEIEKAASMSIPDIFEAYGEPEFRRLEASVIKRIVDAGPQILATGGGAFMNEETRDVIHANGVSLWLSAEIDLLMARVSRKSTRPLLQNPDPRGIMLGLIDDRYPVYAKANLEVASRDTTKDDMGAIVISSLADYFTSLNKGKTNDAANV